MTDDLDIENGPPLHGAGSDGEQAPRETGGDEAQAQELQPGGSPAPPVVAAEKRPGVAVEKGPGVAVEKRPAVAVEKRPAVAVEKRPAVAVEKRPAVAAEKRPAVVAEKPPAVAAEKLPAVAAEKPPAPPLAGRSAGPGTAATQSPEKWQTGPQRVPQQRPASGTSWGQPKQSSAQWESPTGSVRPKSQLGSVPVQTPPSEADTRALAIPGGNTVAVRRAPQLDPASMRGIEANRKAVPADTRMPVPGSGPRSELDGDKYRRSSAPIEAAAIGIRQELIDVATEEHSRRAKTGWRGVLNRAGMSLAPSAKEQAHRDVLRRIRVSKQKMYSIAVVTLKGGAGKTTVTSALGQVFASVRGDGVMAVDTDTSSGDLPMRTAQHPENLSVIDLLQEEDLTQRDFVMRFLSTTESDLQVLANGWRADDDGVLESDDIRDIHEIASHYYSLLLWDSDTNLHSMLMGEVLSKSDAVVLLVQASPQGAVAAGNAIDWLRFHGFEALLARTVLVVNESTRKTRVDMKSLLTVLRRQQLKIYRIPFDKHLDEGLAIDLAKLRKKTLRAFEGLAAMLADDFTVPQPPASMPA